MFDLISFVYGICSCLLFQLIIAVINEFFQSALLKRSQRKNLVDIQKVRSHE